MIVIRVKPKADKPDDDDSASQAGPSTRSETAKKVTFEESTKVKGKKGKGKGKVDTVTEDDDDAFDSGFILSPLMPWTDHRLLPCLIGLSYLALDEEDWGTSLFGIFFVRERNVNASTAHKPSRGKLETSSI